MRLHLPLERFEYVDAIENAWPTPGDTPDLSKDDRVRRTSRSRRLRHAHPTMTETSTDSKSTESSPGAVVLASGGMDSATAAYEARNRGYDLYLLHTSYGQRT